MRYQCFLGHQCDNTIYQFYIHSSVICDHLELASTPRTVPEPSHARPVNPENFHHNGIGHIGPLLRPCAANGCDMIRLQETKWDGTSEIVSSRYYVYFSGNCGGVKDRKGQHRVGQAIKEKTAKKTGKDSIATECILTRLLKSQTLVKSSFVTFVVAYAPTEEMAEAQKMKNMATLNNTVGPVLAREYVFVFDRR